MAHNLSPAGFQEKEHTADWELLVWAPTLPKLLQQAAMGMYALSGVKLNLEPRVQRECSLQAGDDESLLVAFLSELLYFGESEGLGFDRFIIRIEDNTARVQLSGAPIAVQEKEIKAVTFHKLNILRSDKGLRVNIVFDV